MEIGNKSVIKQSDTDLDWIEGPHRQYLTDTVILMRIKDWTS